MKVLSKEQRAYAVAQIVKGMAARGFQQQDLHERSGVAQSTISRIVSPSLNDHYEPTEDTLRKLFKGLGLNYDEIMGDIETMAQKLTGYLASPLTAVVGNGRSEQSLYDLVTKVRGIVCSDRFPDPKFDLYWPGDHTHPTRNQNFTAAQVYLTDRSQASSFDFVVLICASPSYGVGQENEIITQAGLPAIRIVPQGISRMMGGSFLFTTDIEYSGKLETGIDFPEDKLFQALTEVRTVIFEHRALYKALAKDDFRLRLKDLVDDRCGNNLTFAKRLGVNIRYVEALLDEPLAVSNPSAQLLKRMSAILHVSAGFLLGETEEAYPEWVESNASWHEWARNTRGLDAATAVALRDEWREDFRENLKLESSPISPRRKAKHGSMKIEDWNELHKKRIPKVKSRAGQDKLF